MTPEQKAEQYAATRGVKPSFADTSTKDFLAGYNAANEWIDLRISQPEYYKDVLCFNMEDEEANVVVCWLANNGNKNIWTISGTDVCMDYVTHWRELPPPPSK